MPKTAVSLFFGLLAALAQSRPEPSFSPRDVVRQVRSVPPAVSRELAADNGEFLVDTNIAYVGAPGREQSPAVSFDGTNFVVVWEDGRGICATRVTLEGKVLDPLGILVSANACAQPPDVAFDGVNYLVVWTRSQGYHHDIYAARMTPGGVVLDPGGIPVAPADTWQQCPAVEYDGVHFLVVWADRRGSSWDIYGARVTPDGTVLDPSGIAICTAARDQGQPAVSFDGVNSLVVWEDWRGSTYDIYGARVTPGGVVLDPSGIGVSTVSGGEMSPSVAFDGTNYLVVWTDYRGTYNDIYAARVTPGGTVLDPDGIPVSTAADYQLSPDVAFDGTNFLLVWEDRRGQLEVDIYGARVTPQGIVLDPDGIPVCTTAKWQLGPAVALGDTDLLVVWTDERGGSRDIYAGRVTPSGAVLDSSGFVLSTVANNQEYSTVSSDGIDYLVVWSDTRGGVWNSDIYAARVTMQGAVLDPEAIPVCTAVETQYEPAVAFGGGTYLVAWTDWRGGGLSQDIYGARVTSHGAVLDTAGIPIATTPEGQSGPAVAFDGTNFLVVWYDYRGGTSGDVYAARVTPEGAVLDTSGIAIAALENFQGCPAVAFDGANYLVVWTDERSGRFLYDVYGARVTPAGAVLDTNGIAISTAENGQGYQVVSFDGTNFLVAWQDERNGQCDVYAARVTPQGTVLDPAGIAVAMAADNQVGPTVAFDGTDFLVVWTDWCGDSSDIFGARVTSGGVVVDTFPVVRRQDNQWSPALARGSSGQILMAYEGWAGTVAGKTYNAKRIWGKLGPFPGIQETPKVEVRTSDLGPSIVRGVLRLAEGPSASSSPSWLLDATGRKVLALKPGVNDIRHLVPGIYFVHSAFDVRHSTLSAKVVVTN